MYPEVDSGNYSTSGNGSFVRSISPGLHLPFNSRFLGGAQPATRAAVFLDRDGVIVRDVHYLRKPSQIEFLPSTTLLGALRERFYLVVATNQSGIARGLFTEEDLLNIHSELVSQLATEGVVIDAFYYCPHLSSATIESYRVACDCRKPKAGMLLRAAKELGIELQHSYMVGDSARDMEAGRLAGLTENILLRGGPDSVREHRCAKDLSHAVRIILGGAA
jgi:D-glycero-D-manno-heptose 1,7-bisphosphate phosphatase